MGRRLDTVLKQIYTLPTLPVVLTTVLELIRNPKTSAADIGRVISKDQILTARLLKLVNSAFYGFPRRISTVSHAITVIGFDALTNLILATSVLDIFPKENQEGGFDYEGFWEHSIGTAAGAKVIAGFISYNAKEELFVAGLLHDIGKIVEAQFMQKEFLKVREEIHNNAGLMVNTEAKILGYTHARIGGELIDKWGLPASLVEPVALHHEPQLAREFPRQTAAVHLADILCRAKDIGYGGDNKIPPLNPVAWESLGLRISDIEPIMERMETEFEATISALYPSSTGERRTPPGEQKWRER